VLIADAGHRAFEKIGCANDFTPELARCRKLIYACSRLLRAVVGLFGRVSVARKVFVDAGANFGIYTLLASKIVGEAARDFL